jgi:lipopolysaccharide/colanic/teichoic acid biosynthesis glycosyltransferase
MAGHTASLHGLVVAERDVYQPSAWDSAQRACDIALVVLTSPLWAPLLLTALALKLLADGWPMLFRHERLGFGGKPFMMHKIRTTPPDFQAGPDDWSDEDFPPRTRFGRWMRRFDIDELPQLWNVLKGEMSLVGPRPEMPQHAQRFSSQSPEYMQRLTVLPGVSGLAQIRGWRGNTCIHQRLLSDLEYTRRRRAGLYFTILAKTVWFEVRRAVTGDSGVRGNVVS